MFVDLFAAKIRVNRNGLFLQNKAETRPSLSHKHRGRVSFSVQFPEHVENLICRTSLSEKLPNAYLS